MLRNAHTHDHTNASWNLQRAIRHPRTAEATHIKLLEFKKTKKKRRKKVKYTPWQPHAGFVRWALVCSVLLFLRLLSWNPAATFVVWYFAKCKVQQSGKNACMRIFTFSHSKWRLRSVGVVGGLKRQCMRAADKCSMPANVCVCVCMLVCLLVFAIICEMVMQHR